MLSNVAAPRAVYTHKAEFINERQRSMTWWSSYLKAKQGGGVCRRMSLLFNAKEHYQSSRLFLFIGSQGIYPRFRNDGNRERISIDSFAQSGN